MKTLSLFLITDAVRRLATRRSAVYGLVFGALLLSGIAQAGVAIGLTRVIVTGEDNVGSVQILNQGTQPALIQMWVDNDPAEMDLPVETIKVPFVIESPIFRINANTNQWARIFYSGSADQLPSDRESLFWLNVLEVPPKTTADGGRHNELQIAFRSRIKLFYRPAGVPASAREVEQKLSFQLVPTGSGSALRVTNPTPFYVTFLTLELGERDSKQRARVALDADGMVAPKASVELALEKGQSFSSGDGRVFFSIIDDFGSTIESEQALTR